MTVGHAFHDLEFRLGELDSAILAFFLRDDLIWTEVKHLIFTNKCQFVIDLGHHVNGRLLHSTNYF